MPDRNGTTSEVEYIAIEDHLPPWTITFSWGGKTVVVALVNGGDVLKLAKAYQEWLTSLGVPYTLTTTGD